MGGLIMLFMVVVIILLSILMQQLAPYTTEWFGFGFTNSLWNRQETYIVIATLL